MIEPNDSFRKFNLPRTNEHDTSRPSSIVHGCDYVLGEDGKLQFYYSFLDYYWLVDGVKVRARHYLGDSWPLKVAVMIPFREFDQPKYAGVLDYLQRRFHAIETFERDKGGHYVLRWGAASPS
jgi:hypothetical protein